jgi:diguanylate cyclase
VEEKVFYGYEEDASEGTIVGPEEFDMHVDPSVIEIPTPMALAILALLAYVFSILPSRRKKQMRLMQSDLARAQTAVGELENVVGSVYMSTAKHYARLKGFKSRIAKLSNQERDAIWRDLCSEVEGILEPTLQLVSDIANAQNRIRYQSTCLMRFSEMRTDPLTGLGNRRTLDAVLNAQFALFKRYGTPFSLAVIDIDHFKSLNDEHGHLHGDEMLRRLTEMLLDTSRTVDLVARYGGDEFVVVMPHTDLAGATALAGRLREKVEEELPFTVSIGTAAVREADMPESLFHRADSALYRAKNDGRNHVCCDGDEMAEDAASEADLLAFAAARAAQKSSADSGTAGDAVATTA